MTNINHNGGNNVANNVGDNHNVSDNLTDNSSNCIAQPLTPNQRLDNDFICGDNGDNGDNGI